jgi:hypothetical protein
MSLRLRFCLPVLFSAAVIACSGGAEDTSDDGSEADTSQCSSDVQSKTDSSPNDDASGKLQSTTFTVTTSACIASNDAPGLVDKMLALARDDAKLSQLAGKKGPVFASYNAQAPTGDVASADGETRIVDVSFRGVPAKTTLRINVKKAGSRLSLEVVNTKGISAFFITPVEAGGLDVRLDAKPLSAGAGISGTAKATVKAGYEDKLKQVNELPSLFIEWLKNELASEA